VPSTARTCPGWPSRARSFSDGAPGALLVFRADDQAVVDAILAADPFAREGLVADADVRAWELVLGPWSA